MHGEECSGPRLDRRRSTVILLDLGLPDSNGTRTLERTLDATRSIPVVVLTGCADEDVAVDAVAAGAQDYLMKGMTDGRTLFRALRYACERRRAEERIRVSEERYRALVENSADGIALLDGSGTIVYASPAVTRILGWLVEEFEGQNVFRFVHEDDSIWKNRSSKGGVWPRSDA